MITVHSAWADDFSSLGLCPLAPVECTVEEHAGGLFQLKMIHPMDKTGKWWNLQKWNIIKAPTPMRETPLMSISAAGESVTREIWRVKVSSRLRLRNKPSTSSGKIIGRYKIGTKVIKIGESGKWYQVVVQQGGATGWMHSDYLAYVGTETQAPAQSDKPPTVVQPRQTREQLFRIVTVEKDDAAQLVYVTALHVFYDLTGVTVAGQYSPEDVTATEAAQSLFAKAVKPHSFELYVSAAGKVSGEYGGRSIVSAITETDGILAQANARMVRDNFDVFILEEEERDQGVEIRHGKNMLGAVLTEDVSGVVTTVIPVGKTKDGEPLYIEKMFVDAENADAVPVVRAKEISYDVKSGSDEFPDDAAARTELERLANAEFSENGIHLPTVGLDVDFVALENTRQYAEYAALQSVHLYDTVHVISAQSGIDAAARMTGYVYNCLTKRYDSVTLGQLTALETTLSGYDIAAGTVSGNRLVMGSVDGDRIRSASIQYAKIAQAAIEQLSANAITALRAHINELVAGNITTDQLYADLAFIAAAQITAANIDKANINWAEIKSLTAQVAEITAATIKVGKIEWAEIETLNAQIANIAIAKIKDATIHSAQIEDLNATVAKIVSADIKTADIGYAQIKDLLAQKAIITDGVGGSLLIERLAVTSANMLGATIGELVLKGDDGKYYAVIVSADGTIHTQEVTVSAGEIAAGQTAAGKEIVETNMNVGALNAQDIKAQQAIISEIFTSALTAGKITAGEALIASAVIPELYVTTIRAIGESLELVNGRSNVIHRGETPPTDAGENDLWVQPGTGALFQMAAGGAGMPEFYLDEGGVLYYRYGEGQEVYALTMSESGDLWADEAAPFAIAIGPDGQIIAWERVKDAELQAGIDRNKEDIDRNKEDIEGNTALIREQSAKITEMADAIDMRVTTEVYEQGKGDLEKLIQKNESAITLMDESITSKVSQEVYDEELEVVRGSVSEIKQTATDIRLEVSKKTAVFRQEDMPDSYVRGDIWIKPSDGTMRIADVVSDTLLWRELKPSELKTSSIEIAQDHINIETGGNLNVNSGAAHFRTKEYTLSILADDDSEETVMDFDAESKTLRVNEVVAGNARPYIAGETHVTSSEVGGLDGLAGMLAKNQYEHIVYTQESDDLSAEQVIISGSNSMMIEIVADSLVRVPPIAFIGIVGNVFMRNLKWSFSSGNAIGADSGCITLFDCYADAYTGIAATHNARISWIGTGHVTGTMDSAGACTYAAASAMTGGEIKLFGLIPAGELRRNYGGTITAVDTVTGAGGTEEEYVTDTISAAVGYYGTKNGWKGDQLYQGYSDGKGRIYGCMKFDLPAGAGTIRAATLTLHRYKGAGKGSEVDVTIYASSTDFGSQPTLGTKVFEKEDAASPGASASFDVTAAAQMLADGTAKQLVLYTGETKTMSGKVYSSQYAMFDSAVLKITY